MGVVVGAAAGAGAIAAQAIAKAIKASGAIIEVSPENFEIILRRTEKPLVIFNEYGIFSKKYKYLTNYKGLIFFCKSPVTLNIPKAEIIVAGKIWTPNQ
ncbi:MAG: hypothetical protein GY765_23670 [bacterium]|nr:hypothetical protein [bacterium]